MLGPLGGSGFVDAFQAVDGVATVVAPETDLVRDALEEAEILVSYRWQGDWLDTGLQWVQSVSAGTEQFPVERMGEAGVVLTSAVGIHEVQVSEHAFGLLLSLTRGIAPAVRHQAVHRWEWPPVTDLEGMTLGVLGLGTIGEAVGRKGRAFGMRVIGTKRDPDDYDGVATEVHGPEGTLTVFEQADVVIVTLPGSPETDGLVGGAELAALEGGWLVNVGRGSVIDQAALITALDGGLRGAGLDVFETEPLPDDSPLWDLPNVVITPHMAGASPRYAERLAALFERNLAAFHGQGQWVNRVV